MLGKLIKYDIRSTWRDFTALYMAIILGALVIPFLFNNSTNPIIEAVAGFLTAGLFMAIVVVTVVNLFKIYNTNVFSKQGYLTMTLPVKSFQVVTSKLIVSTMWILLTALTSLIGLFILSLVYAPSIEAILIAFKMVVVRVGEGHGLPFFLFIIGS